MSRTISANYSSGVTLTNPADSPVYIAQGVSIGNAAGAGLVNGANYYWAITNGPNAQIDGYSFGVSLNTAGTVVNKGTVAESGTASGFSYNPTTHVLSILSAGLYEDGGGVSNTVNGRISGGIGVALGGFGSVVNAGAITGVLAGKGFAVALAGGGGVTNLSGGVMSGGEYGVLTVGIATVTNQASATITGTVRGVFMVNGAGSIGNQGSINGGSYGVHLATGGTVSNQQGGTISANYTAVLVKNAAGTVNNQGVLYGTTSTGIYMASGGSVTNQSHATINGGQEGLVVGGAAATLTNQGVIQELTPFTTQTYALSGVLLLKGGSVSNAGGTLIGASYGLDIAGVAGTLTNSGLIQSTRTAGGSGAILVEGGSAGNTGTIKSKGFGLLMAYAAGSVTNSGLIASYEQGAGAGVALEDGGTASNGTGGIIDGEWIGFQVGTFGHAVDAAASTFVNQGAVSASDNKGDGAAVWVHGPGVVINKAGGTIQGGINGTISGGPLNGFTNGGFGIVAYYQTTVVNYGSIGGAAYAFDAANTNNLFAIGNLIEMAPGASFGGVVLGAHNAANAGLSTLELMSGASAGSVTGFGTQYKYFGNVTVDNGARWSLQGTVAAGTTVTLGTNSYLALVNPTSVQGTLANFTPGDTIGLNGVTVTGSSFASGVLTLTEASGTITLNVPGTFATGDVLARNTFGGADISLVQTSDRTLSWIGGGADDGFATAANWDDLTNGFDPAQTGPGATDSVLFNSSGGAVTGPGAAAAVDVGSVGSGALQLSGGTIVTGSFDAGVATGAVGQIGLTGTGTELMVTGSATVADDGTGVLSVLSGATFTAANLTVGSLGDSSGALVVSGTGSVLDVSGALNIGTSLGTGDLTVGPGAAIHASAVFEQGQVVLEGGLLDPTVQLINQGQTAGGFGTIAAGDIIDEGAIQAGGNKGSQKLLIVQGTVLGGGTLTVDGTLPGSVPAGILQINAGGTLELSGAVLNAATTTFTDNLTPQGTYTVNNSVIDVNFVDATGVLLLEDIAGFGGTIATYQTGDSFVVAGGTLSGLGVSNGDTLTVSDSGAGAGAGGTDRIIFGSAVSAAGFKVVNNNTIQAQAPCFAAGTLIRTAGGAVPVERLAPGMRATTRDGGSAEIVWIGQRAIDCSQHPDPASVCPVRVLAGAFGPGAPARDLWLSPDHAVFVEGVLIPVHCLINGGTIRQMVVPEVSYFHVELAGHDVIFAEGMPVESYLDTGNRANFSNCGGAVRLFPDFSARMWEMAGCAPLVMTGPVLERVKRALARGEAVVSAPGVAVTRRPPWTRLTNRYTYY